LEDVMYLVQVVGSYHLISQYIGGQKAVPIKSGVQK